MTAKRPTTRPARPARTPQDRARRLQLLDAASGVLGHAGPLTTSRNPQEVLRVGR